MVLCPTALVKLFVDNEFLGLYRALGDTGAHPNLMSHRLTKRNDFRYLPVNGNIMGISNNLVRVKHSLNVSFLPWFVPNHVEKISASVIVLPKSVKWAPIFPSDEFSSAILPSNLQQPLADPFFWRPGKVDLVFGIELFAEIIEGVAHKLDRHLVSQQSSFGHWIYGSVGEQQSNDIMEQKPKSVYVIDIGEIENSMKKFWEFEDLNLCTKSDSEHELIENMFKQTHYRDREGRFVIQIPLKPNITELGSSREAALRRFFILEKRFKREPEFREKYIEFMSEYEQLGHMVEAINPPAQGEMCYHIPHHGVISSTKFRVVFDGSCKTNLGISFNDIQFVGPKLQKDLAEIIMRFRRHKFAPVIQPLLYNGLTSQYMN